MALDTGSRGPIGFTYGPWRPEDLASLAHYGSIRAVSEARVHGDEPRVLGPLVVELVHLLVHVVGVLVG